MSIRNTNDFIMINSATHILPSDINKKERHHTTLLNKNTVRELYLSDHFKELDEGLEPELKFIEDQIRKEKALEDEHLTTQYFNKIKVDEIIAFLFASLSIGSGFLNHEIKYCGEPCTSHSELTVTVETFCLFSVSIGVVLFIISSIFRYINYFRLYRSALYINQRTSFFQTPLWIHATIEIILCIIHPNLLFKKSYFKTRKSWNILEVEYCVNDMLLLVLLIRLFYLVKMIVFNTSFYSARADRVTKMMGIGLSSFFSFKCLMIRYTMRFLIIITGTVCVGLGYMMKVIEGPVYYLSPTFPNLNDYRSYSNCFWNMFVTMTTVGYGDYYPKTFLGRFVIFLTAFAGMILVALTISFLQSQTELNDNEEKALNFLQRLESKDNITKTAAQYFKTNFEYFVLKKKYLRGDILNNQINKDKLLSLALKKNEYRKLFKSTIQ